MAFATGDLSFPFTTDNLLLLAQPETEITTEKQTAHLIPAIALLKFVFLFFLDFIGPACVESIIKNLFRFRGGLIQILSTVFRRFHRSLPVKIGLRRIPRRSGQFRFPALPQRRSQDRRET